MAVYPEKRFAYEATPAVLEYEIAAFKLLLQNVREENKNRCDRFNNLLARIDRRLKFAAECTHRETALHHVSAARWIIRCGPDSTAD